MPDARIVWNFSKPMGASCFTMQQKRKKTTANSSSGTTELLSSKYDKVDPTGLGPVVTWGQVRNILCESDSSSCDEDSSDNDYSSNDENDKSVTEDENPTQVE